MVGQRILFDLLREKGLSISSIHHDCGLLIFDNKSQDTHSGGSGCGCAASLGVEFLDAEGKPFVPVGGTLDRIASVLAAFILPRIVTGQWKRVLFVPTGAMLSKVSFNEGESVPGIAHGIVLEHIQLS